MPSDLGAADWSEVDASNNAVPPNGWPEGMAPSDVNNSARAQMGGEKRWWARSNATQTTTGTSTAYVLTYEEPEAALYGGEETSFVLHVTCGANPTLDRDGLGSKSLRKFDFATNLFVPIAAGDFRINQVLRVRYNAGTDRYEIISASISTGGFVSTSSNNVFTGTNEFQNTVTMTGAALNEAARVNVASATTCNIGAAASNYVQITGNVTITGFGTIVSGARRIVVFAAVLLLTHNGTSLILPGGANITTAAGDTAIFESEGSGNWRCIAYQRASGTSLVAATGTMVGRAYTQNVNYTSLSANIPADNTIPQITEGTQILSQVYTPKSTTNRVHVRVVVPLGTVTAVSDVIACVALFRNGGANAIDAKFINVVDGIGNFIAVLDFEDSPGSGSPQTYTVRAGAGAAIILLNGDLNSRLGGGVSRASMTIEEFVA